MLETEINLNQKVMNRIFSLFIILLFLGCENSKKEQCTYIISHNDTLFYKSMLVADTILHSVTIVNSDPNDEWTGFRLRNVNQESFINEIFDKVYAGKLIAYDYHKNTPLTIDDVKKIEKMPDFSRAHIEEIMFEESWFYSTENNRFYKEVYSIVLAYAIYTEEGIRKENLKAVFKIKLAPAERE